MVVIGDGSGFVLLSLVILIDTGAFLHTEIKETFPGIVILRDELMEGLKDAPE